MNNWIILAVLIVVVVVATIFVNRTAGRHRCWEWPFYVLATGLSLMVAALIIFVPASMIDRCEVNSSVQQKEYIETHIPKSDIEDAMLMVKKDDLNKWLYETQYSKARYGGWSLYPDGVEDLQEIK